MTTSNLKTLIIGCGKIAGGFDMNQNNAPLTHIGAYRDHGKFDINACVEPVKEIRMKFATHWDIENTFSNMDEVAKSGMEFDVISICSPTPFHYSNVCEALEIKPKVIFCEKPLASNYSDAVKIKEMCKNSGVKLAVNHSRRWDPKVIELRNEIASGKIGEVRSVIGFYNKGVLNNGSHMIDLLFNLFDSLNIVSAISPVNDYFEDDPTVTALLKTNTGTPIHLVAAHASEYALFELEIIGSKKTIRMLDGGLNWSYRSIIENSRYPGYKNLSNEKYVEGSYHGAMASVVENIYKAIKQDDKLLCTGHEACEAHRICRDLLEKTGYRKDIR